MRLGRRGTLAAGLGALAVPAATGRTVPRPAAPVVAVPALSPFTHEVFTCLFAPGSAFLDASARHVATEVVRFVADPSRGGRSFNIPVARVAVIGAANDTDGPLENASELARRRAVAVANFMRKQGLSGSMLLLSWPAGTTLAGAAIRGNLGTWSRHVVVRPLQSWQEGESGPF